MVCSGWVVRCRICDRDLANGCCVPTPTQRAIPPGSVNEYQRKLGSKRAYHAMHWPRITVVLRLRLVSGWGLWNGDQRRPMGLKTRERTLLFYMTSCTSASSQYSKLSLLFEIATSRDHSNCSFGQQHLYSFECQNVSYFACNDALWMQVLYLAKN